MIAVKKIRLFILVLLVFLIVFFTISGITLKNRQNEPAEAEERSEFFDILTAVFSNAQIPAHLSDRVLQNNAEIDAFMEALFVILQGDPDLRLLVDKENPLAPDFSPDDLVILSSKNYKTASTLSLRGIAAAALEEMAQAARADGHTLVVLSAYRSFFYQSMLFSRYVLTEGQEKAEKFSARPGHSQHQLGLAVDFNQLDNELAQSPVGIWLAENASRFGWSLSYPDGCEEITGYQWESWHYRYAGKELAAFIDKYFNGIQQFALRFIHEWEYVHY